MKCRYCDFEVDVKQISHHVNAKHNIKYIEYVKQYVDDFIGYWQRCKVCNVMPVRVGRTITCSRECLSKHRRTLPGPNTGNKATLETRKKLSMSHKGQRAWNAGMKMSDEFCKTLSQNHRSKRGIVIKHTDKTKQKLSKIAKKRAQQPDYVNPMAGKTHSSESIAKIIQKRSSTTLELLAKKILLDAGYSITHQFFINDGKTYAYDFKLNELPILIEMDGDYWHGGPGTKKHFYKVNAVKKNDAIKQDVAKRRGYHLIRVWESEMKRNPQILLDRIRELA